MLYSPFLLLIATHLREKWQNNKPSGILEPNALDIYERLSTLMIWLVKTTNPEPAGLVIKSRIAANIFVKRKGKKLETAPADLPAGVQAAVEREVEAYEQKWGELPAFGDTITLPLLPRRLPAATWRDIRRYMVEPADWSNPQPGETPNEREQALMRGVLTPEQAEILKLSLMEAKQAAASEGSGKTVEDLRILVTNAAAKLNLDPDTFKSEVIDHLKGQGIVTITNSNIAEAYRRASSYIDNYTNTKEVTP